MPIQTSKRYSPVSATWYNIKDQGTQASPYPCLGYLVLGVLFLGCGRVPEPKPATPPLDSLTRKIAQPDYTPLQLNFSPACRIRIAPTSGLPPIPTTPTPIPTTLTDDAADSLINMTLAPQDVENGWGWALDVFQQLPERDRAPFIDQVAMLTPLSMWNRLDPILDQPNWGAEVQDRLFHRLLELPLSMQLPRLVRLAMNSYHPSSGKANALLQSYFPDITPRDYPTYLGRMSQP